MPSHAPTLQQLTIHCRPKHLRRLGLYSQNIDLSTSKLYVSSIDRSVKKLCWYTAGWANRHRTSLSLDTGLDCCLRRATCCCPGMAKTLSKGPSLAVGNLPAAPGGSWGAFKCRTTTWLRHTMTTAWSSSTTLTGITWVCPVGKSPQTSVGKSNLIHPMIVGSCWSTPGLGPSYFCATTARHTSAAARVRPTPDQFFRFEFGNVIIKCVDFKLEEGVYTVDKTPGFLKKEHFENRTHSVQHSKFTAEYTQKRSHHFEYTGGFKINAQSSLFFSAGIPVLGTVDGKATLETETEHQWKHGREESTTKKSTYESQLTAASMTTMTAKLAASVARAKVPYEMTIYASRIRRQRLSFMGIGSGFKVST